MPIAGGKRWTPRNWLQYLMLWMLLLTTATRGDQLIYNGALQNGWQNWSWATVDFTNSAPVYTGNSNSISVTCGAYSALYLENSAFNAGLYTGLTFWINGGAGGQSLTVYALTNGTTLTNAYTFIAPTNSWQQMVVPLTALGLTTQTNVTGFWIYNASATTLPVFYVDSISLTSGTNYPSASKPAVSPTNFVYFGSTVSITSSVAGSQPLSYQWQTDGGSGGTLTNIPGFTNATLNYSPLSAGTFQCDLVVSNNFGVYTSGVAKLTVLPSPGPASVNDNYLVYTIQFNNGWGENGWVSNYQTNFSGTNCLVYAASGTYQALWLTHDPIDTTIYTNLTLWLNGGPTGGQQIYIGALQGSGFTFANEKPVTAPTNTWQEFTFSLASLGVANTTNLTGIVIANQNNVPSPFYIANVSLIAAPKPPLVHVGVKANSPGRVVSSRLIGINNVAWDGAEDGNYYPGTLAQITNAGVEVLRWPGGSWGDGYHWTNEAWSYGATSPRTWGSFTTNFIHTAADAQTQAFIIANYGSSTPEEAAQGVAMMNITNHCNFKYWEIGNEIGGFWETDINTNSPWQPHDPWTYAMRFAQYYTQMKAVDPTIKIGAVADTTEDGTANYTNHSAVNPVTGITHYGWTPVMLYTMKTNGVLPDFLIDHSYAPNDGDTYNLLWSAKHWQIDAANLRMMLNDYLGSNLASNIELDATEYGPGGNQQYVSLVGGLFLADAVGDVMQTEFNSFLWWDQHNGQSVVTSPDNALYGWRTNSAGQFISDGGIANGPVVPPDPNCYPTYYCMKLLKYFARGGDTVITVTNDYQLLATYGALRTNGTLTLLVINKSSSANLTAAINLSGYLPSTNAMAYSYGIPQDTAAQTGAGSLDIAQTTLAGVQSSFVSTFAPYSASVIVFSPAPAPSLAVLPGAPGKFVFQLQGQPGARYVLQNSTNLSNWVDWSTNTLSASTANFTNSIPKSMQFWRAVWSP